MGWKDELINEIFPLGKSEILIEEAKKKVGERRYSRLLAKVGPAKMGQSAEVAEKGYYLFKISEVEKRMEATEDILKLPTTWQLEGVKKTRQFRNCSLGLSYLLALIFFLIGFVPGKLLWKILLIIFSIPAFWKLNCKLFSILEKIN